MLFQSNGQSSSILSVLVIGAGTDYALLLVARYREELRKHEDKHFSRPIRPTSSAWLRWPKRLVA